MNNPDRTPKPCQHKQSHHDHGTRNAYVLDKCRCPPCAAAASAYERKRVRTQAYGTWAGLIDASEARAHVQALQAAGLGLKRIAAASEVSTGTLSKLMYGARGRPPARRIVPRTAYRILSVPLPEVIDLGRTVQVPALGARRRVQALVCLGWSISRLAEYSGIDRQALDNALTGDTVTAWTHCRIAILFVELWDTSAPAGTHRERQAAARARNRAARAGWAPSMAWDDIDTDPLNEAERAELIPREVA